MTLWFNRVGEADIHTIVLKKKKIWPISTQLTLNSFFMFYHLEVSDCNTSHINVYCMWVCGTYAVMPPECGCG